MNVNKIKTLGFLFLIIVIASSLTFLFSPVAYAAEEVTNGGFEVGDGFDGWTSYAAVINSTFSHTGTNSSEFEYSDSLDQVYSPEIQSNLTTEFGFWLARGDDDGAIHPFRLECTWNTTFGGSFNEMIVFDENNCSVKFTWYYMDVTDWFNAEHADRWLEQIDFGCGTGGFTTYHLDDVSLVTGAPPSSWECRVISSPEVTADWELDAAPYSTPWIDNITQGSRTLEATEVNATRDSGENIYGFSRWLVTNSSGDFSFTTASVTLDIQEEHNFTIFYEKSYTVLVSASPEINAGFTATGYAFTTPKTLTRNNETHTFVCTDYEVPINASYKYTFDYWTVNGSGHYGNLNIDVDIAGDTNMTMVYAGESISPDEPIFAHDAGNITLYMRSDTHTINEEYAYRLDVVNTVTPSVDSRTAYTEANTTYGIRAWAIDIHGNEYELTSGKEALVTRSTNGEGIQSATFNCPAFSTLIDSIKIYVYQLYSGPFQSWSLRRKYISIEQLYWKLPEATWTIYYWTNRTYAGGQTDSYFRWGAFTYNSRAYIQYYSANPWEIALARLNQANYFGFFFTPWTYWFGEVFWAILLFFAFVTTYPRWKSIKFPLALLWLFGGAGSILDSMLPAVTIHIAWLMLALGMGLTFFKLLYGQK